MSVYVDPNPHYTPPPPAKPAQKKCGWLSFCKIKQVGNSALHWAQKHPTLVSTGGGVAGKRIAAKALTRGAEDVAEDAAETVGGRATEFMGSADNYTAAGHPVSYIEDATALGSDPSTMNNFTKVAKKPGVHDVVAHGKKNGLHSLNGEDTNPGQTVEAIRGNTNYVEGQQCRLLICHSGVSGAGQEIADEVEAPVLAPTDRVGTNPRMGGGQEPIIDNGGSWVCIYPR